MHFWHAADGEPWRRPDLRPGPLLPGRLCARLSGRPAHRRAAQQLPPGGRRQGLSSYPHPWLMPDFWQFPTVSMGLGPLMAIYQARFLKYLHARGLADTEQRKVWVFCGDGEMDEPESLGAISLAGREKLDNLDLRHQLQPAAPRRPGARQRQDHPGTRGRFPRRRLERDQGASGARMGRAARQGHLGQAAPADGGVPRRRVPGLQVQGRRLHPREFLRPLSRDRGAGRRLVRREDLEPARGGHDPAQVYAAYDAATTHKGQPDRHPRQDRQGLRHGRRRRGPDDHPPAEEDGRGIAEAVPRPLQPADLRRGAQDLPLPPPAGGQRGDELSARAPRGAGRLSSRPPRQDQRRRSWCRRSRLSRRS